MPTLCAGGGGPAAGASRGQPPTGPAVVGPGSPGPELRLPPAVLHRPRLAGRRLRCALEAHGSDRPPQRPRFTSLCPPGLASDSRPD